MLLVSVDASYHPTQQITDATRKKARDILGKAGVNWPNVFVSEGWDSVLRELNMTGYGSIFVDADGIVRGVGIHAKEAEELLKKYPAKAPKSP